LRFAQYYVASFK